MSIEAVVKTTKNNRRVKMASVATKANFGPGSIAPKGAFNGLTPTQQQNLARERTTYGAFEKTVKAPAEQKSPVRKGLEAFTVCVILGGAAVGITALFTTVPYILITVAVAAVVLSAIVGIAVCAKNGGFNEAARNEFKETLEKGQKSLEEGWDRLTLMRLDDFIGGPEDNEEPQSNGEKDPVLEFFGNDDSKRFW
jgi:hypothetical protein